METKTNLNSNSNHPDHIYFNAMNQILSEGELRETRNAQTISKFGLNLEFDISESFPLLTTKQMYWKGIVHELLWFIRGSTNSKELEELGVNIWKGNSSREFLDSIGLSTYPEGECGPIYGHQWRNFNSQGYDQLTDVIQQIKTDPTSRRIFMSGWNPVQMKQMCLPPCHVSYQFYVSSKCELSCQLYMRSADGFLGLPFNIASSALLTYMIAAVTGTRPSKLLICIGDAHIYTSHIEQIKSQMKRIPLSSPQVKIHGDHTNIDNIKYEDIELQSYQSHGKLLAPMIA